MDGKSNKCKHLTGTTSKLGLFTQTTFSPSQAGTTVQSFEELKQKSYEPACRDVFSENLLFRDDPGV
jgi:hypothetical protein